MSNAQNRLNSVTPNGRICELGTVCPPFLQQLETEDFESRFAGLGFLDSRAPVCQIPVTQSRSPEIVNRFANAAALQRQLARTFPEIGQLGTNTATACSTSSRSDASARYRVAKFYMYSKRLNDGATRAVEEISAINSLLGETDSQECRGRGSINQAYQRCQALKQNCPSAGSQLAAVAVESAADESRYNSIKEQITQLQRNCLARSADFERFAANVSAASPSRNHCEQVFVERQAPRQICYNYTWAEKQSIQQCRQGITSLQIAKGALEDKNPWFRSSIYFELRKTKSVAESIRIQSHSNRTELRKKLLEFEGAALCVIGASAASACDTDRVRATLASTPEIPESFSGDRLANAATLYLGAQSCIEEAVRDQTQTAATLRGLAGDAALTVATAGLSGFAIAARSAVAVSRGARVAGIAALSIDGYYASQSYAAVVRACSAQVNRIQIAMSADPNTMCPGPLSNASQAQKEYSNCAANAAFAALDSLPLVPFIPKIQREISSRRTASASPAAVSPAVAASPAAAAPLSRRSFAEMSSEQNYRDFEFSESVRPSVARAQIVRTIDLSKGQTVEYRGQTFEGQSNNGLEILRVDGREAFAKITFASLTPGPNSVRPDRINREVFYTDVLSRTEFEGRSLGPPFLGTFTREDGYYRIATDFVEGTHIHTGYKPDDLSVLTAENIDQMERMAKFLLDSGTDPIVLQFILGRDGRPFIIDPAMFERLEPRHYQQRLEAIRNDFNILRAAKGLPLRGSAPRSGATLNVTRPNR